jgi:predicted thioesterase
MEGHEVKAIRESLGTNGKPISKVELARRLTAIDGKRVSWRTVESWEQEIGDGQYRRGISEENERKLNELRGKA